MVITLLLQRRLHIRNDLVRRHAIVCVNRPIPCIVRVGIVTPGGEPVTGIPIIRRSEREHDVVTVMAAPPVLIVPLRLVVAKNRVPLALPILASLNSSSLLESHWRRFCGIGLFGKIEVPRLDRVVLGKLIFRSILGGGCVRLVWLASLDLAGIFRLGRFPFIRVLRLPGSLCLVLLVLLPLISSVRSLSPLSVLFLIPGN